ncbi:hypothetical protein BGZ65_011101, partial [Modicella reniformis]
IKELEHEAKVYEALEQLQEHWILVVRVAGVANVMEMILVTNIMGTNIVQENLDCCERAKIRTALSKI